MRHGIAGFLVLAFGLSLRAQTGMASIQGVVTDPSGSLIPNATVLLEGQPATRKVTTNGQGRYVLTGLPAGSYILRVNAAGFTPYVSGPYALSASGRQTVDVLLAIRTENEQVTVAETTKVETDPASNAGATVLRQEDLEALPDDRDDLAMDLQALAGPAAGPNGGQIYIDGFTGGRLAG